MRILRLHEPFEQRVLWVDRHVEWGRVLVRGVLDPLGNLDGGAETFVRAEYDETMG